MFAICKNTCPKSLQIINTAVPLTYQTQSVDFVTLKDSKSDAMTTRYEIALMNEKGKVQSFGFSARKTKSVLFEILDENVAAIVSALRLAEPEKAKIKWNTKRQRIAILPAEGMPPIAEFGFCETQNTVNTQIKQGFYKN